MVKVIAQKALKELAEKYGKKSAKELKRMPEYRKTLKYLMKSKKLQDKYGKRMMRSRKYKDRPIDKKAMKLTKRGTQRGIDQELGYE